MFVDIFEFYFVFNLLHNEMERCLNRSASYLGLSVLELQVLWIASSAKMATIADMARITTHTKEELEEVVIGLEQDNLVERVCFEESYYTFIQTSDRGKQLIGQLSNRPHKCKCPLCIEDQSIHELIEETRDLVVKLRGQGSCDLIANLSQGAR